jgi:lipid-binding SYLF domain-containing protein
MCIAVGAAVLATLAAVPAGATDPERKVRVSTEVYKDFFGAPEGSRNHVAQTAVCIAVIPNLIKGAIGVGGHKGTGVISCKGENGWSPPAFIKMTGGSLGLQLGGQESDLVLFFMTRRGVESLLDSKFTLGGEAGVAAGPYGSTAETSTDLRFRAEIYAYARSRGLFAGVSLEGGTLTVNQKLIKHYYGERIWPEEILFEHQVPAVPEGARAFMEALPAS